MPISYDWIAAFFGIVGALLLARNNNLSGYGFVLFAISNGLWIIYAIGLESGGLLIQQLFFSVTSLYGIYTWLIKPRAQKTP